MPFFFTIALPRPLDKMFTYKADTTIPKGTYVKVPFSKNELLGIVWDNAASSLNIARNYKNILHIYQLPTVQPGLIDFITRFASYNMTPLGKVIKMMINSFYIPPAEPATSSYPEPIHYKNITFENKNRTILASLSTTQQSAATKINHYCNASNTILLDGVTGSGKTEVYLTVLENILAQGAQALILLPEIVLTTQLLERFKRFLPNYSIAQWHSSLTTKHRQTTWYDVTIGKAKLIVGARSALFLPFYNLKIIIVDEEHDASFKQEEGVLYNARDMAVLRAKCQNIPIILSSATPSIESIVNVQNGKYKCVRLPTRFGNIKLPIMQLIDMNKEHLNKQRWVSNTLKHHVIAAIENKKQAMLFLNRKGYAPVILCRSCGNKAKCIYCDFWLVWHKEKQQQCCHYCGYVKKKPPSCSTCGNSNFIVLHGPGIERIEEELRQYIPYARVATLTGDTSSNVKKTAAILKSIKNHEIDIILGTQVIAKGLDFGKLYLVGIIDADCFYNGGDIRALERAYQLLYQVSGRAGRQDEQGLALLQTYSPNNNLLQTLISGNRDYFIEEEIANRKEAQMPPFSRLAIIEASSRIESSLLMTINQLQQYMPTTNDEIQILGPSPAPMFFLRGMYRYRFIIKANKTVNIQAIIHKWVIHCPKNNSVKIKICIDPYNFM